MDPASKLSNQYDRSYANNPLGNMAAYGALSAIPQGVTRPDVPISIRAATGF